MANDANQIKNDLKDKAQDVKNEIKDAAHDIKNKVKDASHDLKNDAKDLWDNPQDAEQNDSFWDTVKRKTGWTDEKMDELKNKGTNSWRDLKNEVETWDDEAKLAWDNFKNKASGFWNDMKNKFDKDDPQSA